MERYERRCPEHLLPVVFRPGPGRHPLSAVLAAVCQLGHDVPAWCVLDTLRNRIVAGGSLKETYRAFDLDRQTVHDRQLAVVRGARKEVGAQ